MRITFKVPTPTPTTSKRAARAIVALEDAGVIEQIAFDPYGETSIINELVNAGFAADKTIEVRTTNGTRIYWGRSRKSSDQTPA